MNNEKILIIILGMLILFGIIIHIASINKDITAEESDFVNSAKAIEKNGEPRFYRSEQQINELALWHPPMYIYSMALAFKIFGINEIASRSINLIFSLLTALLIFIFSINAFGNRGKIIGLISSAFFLVNYYVFSSSVMIDIDILSTFFVFGFIFCIFMHYKTDKKIYAILAIFSFIFSLANRYPIAGLVFLALLGYFIIKKDIKNYSKQLFLIVFIASLISLIIWIGYTTLIWISYSSETWKDIFLSFLIHNVELGSEQLFSNLKLYFFSFLLNIAQLIRLATFPFGILMVISFFYFIKSKNMAINLLVVYSGIILLFFLAIPRPAFGYPRYFVSAFPGLIILTGLIVYKSINNIKLNYKTNFILVIGFISTLILLILLSPSPTIYDSKGLIISTNLPDFIFNIFCTIPVFLIFTIEKEKRAKLLIILLVVIALAYCFYFNMALVLHNSYIKETGEYIKINTSPNDLIIAPRAIGYYAERPIYINDNNKPQINNLSKDYIFEYIIKSYKDRNMEDEFFWPKDYFGGIYEPVPDTEILEKAKYIVTYYPINNDSPERIIGDFYIYNMSQISI